MTEVKIQEVQAMTREEVYTRVVFLIALIVLALDLWVWRP